jgi:hypothetical protein
VLVKASLEISGMVKLHLSQTENPMRQVLLASLLYKSSRLVQYQRNGGDGYSCRLLSRPTEFVSYKTDMERPGEKIRHTETSPGPTYKNIIHVVNNLAYPTYVMEIEVTETK